MNLGLVSCTKSKQSYPCEASKMYSKSAYFRKAYGYAKKAYDQVCILSATYGLFFPDSRIAPYDLTLKNMTVEQRRAWANRVFNQIRKKLLPDKIDQIFFHAGKSYRELLIPKLEAVGIRCIVPLKGLSFGQQLRWYNKHDPIEFT